MELQEIIMKRNQLGSLKDDLAKILGTQLWRESTINIGVKVKLLKLQNMDNYCWIIQNELTGS